MLKKFIILFFLISFVLIGNAVFAVSFSDNFKVYNGQINPISGGASSDNFKIETGGRDIVGKTETDNYKAQAGAAFGGSEAEDPTTSGSGGGIFLSGDSVLPKITDLQILNITESQAAVFFSTDELAVAYIQYGEKDFYNFQTGSEDSFRKTHNFLLGNLSPYTFYNFTIHLKNTNHSAIETGSYSFTTLPIIKAVLNPADFTANPFSDYIHLLWSNPDFSDFIGIKLVRGEDYYPLDIQDGILLFDGIAEEFKDENIEIGKIYYYTIFAYDKYGNFSSGAVSSARIDLLETEEETETPIGQKELSEQKKEDKLKNEEIKKETEEEEITIEEEISDEEAFKEIIPAEPLPLPPDIKPVPKEEETKFIDKTVEFFSLVRQGVDKNYNTIIKVIKKISNSSKAKLNEIKEGLFDGFGRLKQGVFEFLTQYEKKQIKEIIEEEIGDEIELKPEDAEPDVNIVPVKIKTEDFGADWIIVADSDAMLSLPASMFIKPVEIIIATISKQAYSLKYNSDNNSYEAIIKAPKQKGKYQVIIQIIYADNTFEELHKVVLVDPYGFIYTKKFKKWNWKKPWQIFTKEKARISSAKITLYFLGKTGEWDVWPAYLYNQYNPQKTDKTGEFSFVAPPGKYYLAVEAKGYKNFKSDEINLKSEMVNMKIEIEKQHSFFNYKLLFVVLFCAILLLLLLIFKLKFKIKR